LQPFESNGVKTSIIGYDGFVLGTKASGKPSLGLVLPLS